ncbi:DUF6134 family protein [Dongia sedimenti]|uniref:DUF6134 family protein n=1 Tax=Dongia sedimenti TaxID=3064282 RepID=A0ABU0YFM9_9PROT|nr:DUF6134 family protein [Rhodospirillaceae bacterium R-7]
MAGAAGCFIPRGARAATKILMPDAAANRRFSVLYQGNKIGSHTIKYSAETGETLVETKISLLVKAGIFTVFSFRHRSAETWRAGRLVSLRSSTYEHDTTLIVEGTATPEGFRVDSRGGPFIAPAATLTSNSLWTPAVLEQDFVVDAQHGGVIGVSARKVGVEDVIVAGRQIHAMRYSFITPYLAGAIWYSQEDLWVRGEFERDGAKIQYELDT